jgi:putative tryptophan/tyrosine transport system substrate-binding protein
MRRREFITLIGGVMATWPLAARAQQTRRAPVVGYLWHAANAEEEGPYFKALLEGFIRLGYEPGHNVTLEHRFPNETPDLFNRMAAELVSLKPDVLMGGAVASSYLKKATSEIPIVFMFVPDPIGLGLVESLAHPGGNATGFVNFGRDRLESLKEIIPGLARVALLVNSDQPTTRVFVDETKAAADELGLSIQIFDARARDALGPVFDSMTAAKMQALVTASGGTIFQWREIVAKLALNHRIPFCAFSRETFEVGALMSYGADQIEMCRASVVYVDKILKGAKPSDLPVQQPTKLELLINSSVAKVLGLNIPQTLLATADEVIE